MRYYSNSIQRDLFLIKLIPLFFMYSIYWQFFNWWKLPYFFKSKTFSKTGYDLYTRKQYFLKFRKRRYMFFTKSKFVLFTEDNTPIWSIPISNRKSLFYNIYFSKLWILHIFGWLVLKFNLLIPKSGYKDESLLKESSFSTLSKEKILSEKNTNTQGSLLNYSNKRRLLHNILLYKLVLNFKKTSLESFTWF